MLWFKDENISTKWLFYNYLSNRVGGNNCNYAAVNPDSSVARELFVSNLFWKS